MATDPRALMAETMLDRYHTLRTRFATRQAIYNVACAKHGILSDVAVTARQEMASAKIDLALITNEILQLMGVDQ